MIEVRQTLDLDQLAPLLSRALRFDVEGEGGELLDMVRGCCLFGLWDGSDLVGAFAARLDRYSDGNTISVTAAGGLPGYDLVGVIDAWAQLQAAGGTARRLTCTTRRPGLVKRLRRAGYHVAGYVLKKDVIHGQA